MRQSTITTIRSYRIYLRDAENVLAQGHDAELPSDEEARELAARMIGEHTTAVRLSFSGQGAWH
jgi:hypothetical protein